MRYHHARFRSVLPDGLLLIAALAGAVVWTSLLWEVRDQAQDSFNRSGTGFVEAVAGDVQHNLESVLLSVQRTARVASTPGIWAVPAGVRAAALFAGPGDTVRRGSATIIIDKDGRVVGASGDRPTLDVKFRNQYDFEFHRTHSDLNPLITAKAVGNQREEKLIVSQRFNDSAGNFAGVVAEDFSPPQFRELHLDQGEAAALINIDGTVLSSLPSADWISGTTRTTLIRHVTDTTGATYMDDQANGEKRLIAYKRLGDQPLVVVHSRIRNGSFSARLKFGICTGLLLLALVALAARLISRLGKDRSSQSSAERHARLNAYALATANEDLERQISEEIHARDDALRQLARGQRLEALGQLSSGIAHDINNVLQTISGACSLMQNRGRADPEINRLASVALSAALRGSAVTRRLLAFARQAITDEDDVETRPILQDLQLLLNQTLCGSIVVELDLDDQLPSFQVDRMQFETVIINLATNARDAMPNGGTITIGARTETIAPGDRAAGDGEAAGLRPGRYIRVSVADTGTGMDEETLARATEPFFSTKEVDKGTGLGLSMAKTFAEQSKGKCEISSSVGSGTTVTLWFPAAEKTRVDFLLPERGSRNLALDADNVRLLVVDDNDQSRELVSEGLGDAGFNVFQAGSGAEALSLIQGGLEIDLLLTDLSMPRMDGIQLIGAVRGLLPRLPAIVLTGNTDAVANLAIEDEVGGNCLVLAKPVHLNKLLGHIATVLIEGTSAEVVAREAEGALLVD